MARVFGVSQSYHAKRLWDFIHDRTMCRGPLKLLSLVDEYTRECLALEVSGSITAQDAIAVLRRQFFIRVSTAVEESPLRRFRIPQFRLVVLRPLVSVATTGDLPSFSPSAGSCLRVC